MSIYSKPSADLVYDLINEANPGLPFLVSPSNVKLGVPSIVTPGVGTFQDTQIALTGKVNSPFIGTVPVKYRRISLTKLFTGVQVEIHKYSPRLPGGAGTLMFTVYELLADINNKFGLSLTQDDVNDVNITRPTNQNSDGKYERTVTVTTKTTSLGFVGSFALRWVEAAQDIDTMITVTDLNGRLFPGGNVFDQNHLKIMNGMTYATDWTDDMFAQATSWNKSGFTRVAMASNTSIKPFYENVLIPYLNSTYGLNLTWADWSARWYHTCLVLPATTDDSLAANSKYYNRALVLEAPTEAGEKGVVGRLFVHFNV